MGLRGFLKELHRRRVYGVAVAYVATAAVLLEVLTHLFHNFEAPQWVLKVITTLLILGLPVACLMAWGFEFKEGGVRSIPREPKETKPALPAPEAMAPPPSIAVLPFEDMSPEQDQKYLGNGIAEELLNALAGIEELKVAARTSSFALAARGASMKEIGDTLHVRHVLEGSVRRSGQKLRITAQLVDVESGFHLFSQSYDREVQDIFEIQNQIAHEIAGALLPKLGLSKDVMLVKQGTTNLEAYNLRLKAREWLLAPDQTTATAAIQPLRQALALDPNYWDARADLAYVRAHMTVWASDPVPELVEAAGSTAIALLHSPDNVVALICQAYVTMLVHRDAAASASYYDRARAAGADQSVWAYNKAYVLDGPLGRYEEAIAYLKEAERKDPLAANVKDALMEMYSASGRNGDAVATAEALLALNVKTINGITNAARIHAAAGNVPRARDLLQTTYSMVGQDDISYLLGHFGLAQAIGDHAGARLTLERLLQQNSEGRGPACFVIGEGYKTLGDYDQAIAWWTRSVDRHENSSLSLMPARNRNHPVIGKDPRFLALLKRMGLEGDEEKKVAGT